MLVNTNRFFYTTKSNRLLLIICLGIVMALSACKTGASTDGLGSGNYIDLSGNWQVSLDSMVLREGHKKQSIELPGTLDDAGIGTLSTLKPELTNDVLTGLARKHQYIGKARYEREINIPQEWKDKPVELMLERVIWKSTVYVDGQEIDSKNSLSAPHRYMLDLAPGKRKLAIVVDNTNIYPDINVKGDRYPDPINQDMAHAYTNHTQIKWNGILGEIALKVMPEDAPKNLQIYPDAANNAIKVVFEKKAAENVPFTFEFLDAEGTEIFSQEIDKPLREEGILSFSVIKPEELELWDEFNPKLYTARLTSGKNRVETTFGFRQIANDSGTLTLNGHRIFLRGNLECSIFPLTGHPPLEKEGWAKLIAQAKDYGLNHLRFHSYCPPEAAFAAADEAGFYLQVELPHWSLHFGEDQKTVDFLKQEGELILKEYGNHPSFMFFAMGNELQGKIKKLNDFTADLKKKDRRHLYATTTFSFQKPAGTRPEPEDDFFVTQWTEKGWIRGQGIFNEQPPNFKTDYSANSDFVNVPLISHEIGQYSVYPDLSEIDKYTGVLDPINFKAVREDLKIRKMLDLAPQFTQASGKLAALLYKEEIERALKTPAFDGFQLLQLQDFPGQGTALVGLLNAFWESKGVISAEEFRQFNSPVTPLARFEKAMYEDGESFSASIEVANFMKEIKGQKISYTIINEDGKSIFSESKTVDLKIGNNVDLAQIDQLLTVDKAARFKLEISLDGTEYKNSWHFWVYPKAMDLKTPEVLYTRDFAKAIALLNQGKTVLLNPKVNDLEGVTGRFVPVFWSPVHFPDQPGTMGLLVNTESKALVDFPTSSHTEWQWWDLTKQSKAVVLPNPALKPAVRVIDNFVTNRHLATVFEARVGEGKVLFCSMNLAYDLGQRPVARQLRYSLSRYIANEDFKPDQEITPEELLKLKAK